MKLVGGEYMLTKCPVPQLVHEIWDKDLVRELIAMKDAPDKLKEKILPMLRADETHTSYWVGTNLYQMYYEGKTELNEMLKNVDEDTDFTKFNTLIDTNIVGDADPAATLWVIIEGDEYKSCFSPEFVTIIETSQDEVAKEVKNMEPYKVNDDNRDDLNYWLTDVPESVEVIKFEVQL